MIYISVTEMWKLMLKMTSLLGGGNGFQMSFGIGAFQFGFFATNFNMGESGHTHVHGMRGQNAPEGSAQFQEEQFLHKVFLWVAFLFIFWLLVA
jgi:E3 ubiquitin-protein ligase RNF5